MLIIFDIEWASNSFNPIILFFVMNFLFFKYSFLNFTALSIFFSVSFDIITFSDSSIIILANISLFFAESFFESFTPILENFFIVFLFAVTEAITNGPIIDPLPASSIPDTSDLFKFFNYTLVYTINNFNFVFFI